MSGTLGKAGSATEAQRAAVATGPAGGGDAAGSPVAVAPEAPVPGIRVDARALEAALLDIRRPIVGVPLPLECAGAEGARTERRRLLSQIDDYLLPRLRQAGAPILIAIVGSTGAGKSTLLNSLVGEQVSATGIRRPTTNSPVLACHPGDAGWFAENVFLPMLPRVRQQGLARPGRDGLLVLAASERLSAGTALLDTPDIDSVVAAHRQFASQFLDACDLWLFITTARRYADAAVWELLKDARDRGAALVIVLSRVPPDATGEVSEHFDAMLAANGLGGVPRFVITETTVTDSMLPASESDPVRLWIEDTARRQERRIAILTQTMSGVLDTFPDRLDGLARQAVAQRREAEELSAAVAAAYQAAAAEPLRTVGSGALLAGDLLDSWQRFAGAGALLATLRSCGSRRRPARARQRALPAAGEPVRQAIRSALSALTAAAAGQAAEQAVRSWQDRPAGSALLAAAQDTGAALTRSSGELAATADDAVADWLEHLEQLAGSAVPVRHSAPATAPHDSGALGLALAIAALGYPPDAAARSVDPGSDPQSLLRTHLSADQAAQLPARARQQLQESIGTVLTAESARFTDLVGALDVPDAQIAAGLQLAARQLRSAR